METRRTCNDISVARDLPSEPLHWSSYLIYLAETYDTWKPGLRITGYHGRYHEYADRSLLAEVTGHIVISLGDQHDDVQKRGPR